MRKVRNCAKCATAHPLFEPQVMKMEGLCTHFLSFKVFCSPTFKMVPQPLSSILEFYRGITTYSELRGQCKNLRVNIKKYLTFNILGVKFQGKWAQGWSYQVGRMGGCPTSFFKILEMKTGSALLGGKSPQNLQIFVFLLDKNLVLPILLSCS